MKPAASLLAVLGFGALLSPANTTAKEPARPNVLVIVTDDQRAEGTLSVMPATRRWFRGGGVEFTNAFATTPLCCPSRASIFTGRYAHNHGVMGNTPRLLDQRSTLQAKLGRAGYLTGIAGKYLNRWRLGRRPPRFHRWAIFDPLYQGRAYFGARFNVDGRIRTAKGYSTDFIAARAESFLRSFDRRADARPWLLFVTPFAPHGPATPEPAYRHVPVGRWGGSPGVRERDRSDKPMRIRAHRIPMDRIRDLRRRQLRSLRSVDDLVQRVFTVLGRLGERSNTLAFFVSDNGFLWGEHGVPGKRVPYTESIRVPLFLRWPRRVPGGTRDARIAANIDLAPTALEAAGVYPSIRFPTDGRPLLASARRDRILLELSGRVHRWASTRTGRYQYVEHYDRRGRIRFREYYDLVRDPWQLRNLLADGDAGNDPDVPSLAGRLARDRRCGPGASPACP